GANTAMPRSSSDRYSGWYPGRSCDSGPACRLTTVGYGPVPYGPGLVGRCSQPLIVSPSLAVSVRSSGPIEGSSWAAAGPSRTGGPSPAARDRGRTVSVVRRRAGPSAVKLSVPPSAANVQPSPTVMSGGSDTGRCPPVVVSRIVSSLAPP